MESIARAFLPMLADAAIKGAALLLLAAFATLLMRRASAAARHLVWFGAVAAVLVLPMFSRVLPAWHVLPRWMDERPAATVIPGPAQEVTPPPRIQSPPADLPPSDTHLIPTYTPPPELLDPGNSLPSPILPPVPPRLSVPAPQPPVPHRTNWPINILLAWLLGTFLYCCYILLGCVSLRRLYRHSSPITDPGWLDLLDQARRSLGFRRGVRLIAAPNRDMPMTWGLWRTYILIPSDTTAWTPEQRRSVLLHELAHAKRLDCLSQLLTQLVIALYWFNPLLWIAWKRMQCEREQACDDLVLSTGAKASAYAEQLLHIAAAAPAVRHSAAIAMARPSKLENRLRAILDATRNRRGITPIVALCAVLLIAAIAVPLAMVRANSETNTASAVLPGANGTSAKPLSISVTCLPIVTDGKSTTYRWHISGGQPHRLMCSICTGKNGELWGLQSCGMGNKIISVPWDIELKITPTDDWIYYEIARRMPNGVVRESSKFAAPKADAQHQLLFHSTPRTAPTDVPTDADLILWSGRWTGTDEADATELAVAVRVAAPESPWPAGAFLGGRLDPITAVEPIASLPRFPAVKLYINNRRFGTNNGLVTGLGTTGSAQCGHPGVVSDLSWKFLRSSRQGDEYQFTRNFPFDAATIDPSKIVTKTIVYAGKPMAVFEDAVQRIVIFPASLDFQDAVKAVTPTINPGPSATIRDLSTPQEREQGKFHWLVQPDGPLNIVCKCKLLRSDGSVVSGHGVLRGLPDGRAIELVGSLTSDGRYVLSSFSGFYPQQHDVTRLWSGGIRDGFGLPEGITLSDRGINTKLAKLTTEFTPITWANGNSQGHPIGTIFWLMRVAPAGELKTALDAEPPKSALRIPDSSATRPATDAEAPARNDGFAVIQTFGDVKRTTADAVIVGTIADGSARIASLPIPHEIARLDDLDPRTVLGVGDNKLYVWDFSARPIHSFDLATGKITSLPGDSRHLPAMQSTDPMVRGDRQLEWGAGENPNYKDPATQPNDLHDLFIRTAFGLKYVWSEKYSEPPSNNLQPEPPTIWLDDRHALTLQSAHNAKDFMSEDYQVMVVDLTTHTARSVGKISGWPNNLIAPCGNGGDAIIIANSLTNLAKPWVLDVKSAIAGTGKLEQRPARWGAFTLDVPNYYGPSAVGVHRLLYNGRQLAIADPHGELVISVSPDGSSAIWQIRPPNYPPDWQLYFFTAGQSAPQRLASKGQFGMPVWFAAAPATPTTAPAPTSQPATQPASAAASPLLQCALALDDNAESIRPRAYLDLDDGDYVPAGTLVGDEFQYEEYRRIDLAARRQDGGMQIIAIAMQVASADPPEADLASPALSLDAAERRLAHAKVSGETPLRPGITYFFRSRQGDVGALRVGAIKDGSAAIAYRIFSRFSWGGRGDGVQARLRGDSRWTFGQTPTFMLDLRNIGKEPFDLLGIADVECKLLIDGKWYGYALPIELAARVSTLDPGEKVVGMVPIDLSSAWALPLSPFASARPGNLSDWGRHLSLAVGRHTLAVLFANEGKFDHRTKVHALSNMLEFDIAPAPSSAPATHPAPAAAQTAWFGIFPVGTVKSIADFRPPIVGYGTAFTQPSTPADDLHLEIRSADNGRRIAEIPSGVNSRRYMDWMGGIAPDADALRRIGPIANGNYLAALVGRGEKRFSNVIRLTFDSKYAPAPEPTLRIEPMPMGPGEKLPSIWVIGNGPKPMNQQFTNASVMLPTLIVDGVRHDPIPVPMAMPVGPIRPGQDYAYCVRLANYTPPIAPEAQYRVSALAAGYNSAAVTIPIADSLGPAWDAATPGLLPLNAQAIELQGTIIDKDGKPAAGAEVMLQGPNPSGATAAREICDDHGRYAFVNVPAGRYTLWAEPFSIENFAIQPDKTVTQDFSNVGKFVVAGRLTYRNGAPAPGKNLDVSAESDNGRVVFDITATTDAQGRYTVHTPFDKISQVMLEGIVTDGPFPDPVRHVRASQGSVNLVIPANPPGTTQPAEADFWGTLRPDLEYRLTTPHTTLALNQQALVWLEVKNTSDSPRKLLDGGDLDLRLVGVAEGGTVQLTYQGGNDVVIKPHDSLTLAITFKAKLAKAGRYPVQCDFQPNPKDSLHGHDAFRACPPLALHVVAPGPAAPTGTSRPSSAPERQNPDEATTGSTEQMKLLLRLRQDVAAAKKEQIEAQADSDLALTQYLKFKLDPQQLVKAVAPEIVTRLDPQRQRLQGMLDDVHMQIKMLAERGYGPNHPTVVQDGAMASELSDQLKKADSHFAKAYLTESIVKKEKADGNLRNAQNVLQAEMSRLNPQSVHPETVPAFPTTGSGADTQSSAGNEPAGDP